MPARVPVANWLILFGIFVFAGCTPHQQYRTVYEVCPVAQDAPATTCDDHAIQEHDSGYLLNFIEFDDQGQLWHRPQMDAVMDRLWRHEEDRDLLVVVFVHGWKHSARPGDSDIAAFRELLRNLAQTEQQLAAEATKGEAARPPRLVAGVYLGWRGGSVAMPLVEELTFWDRKNTAEKVGRLGVQEVLSRLEQLRTTRNVMDEDHRTTRLVVVGHSFGAAVVYAALASELARGFIFTDGEPLTMGNVQGFGDLVVLVNPAFEALLFAPLSDMAAERGTYFREQLPVLAILTSEADRATRYAFPAGRAFSTVFEKTRGMERQNAAIGERETIAQGPANRRAIGHFAPYRTHRLYPSGETTRAAAVARLDEADGAGADEVAALVRAAADWHNDRPGSEIQFGPVILERTTTSAARNPYLVTAVDADLIRSHNDIHDPRLLEFISGLIYISTTPVDE